MYVGYLSKTINFHLLKFFSRTFEYVGDCVLRLTNVAHDNESNFRSWMSNVNVNVVVFSADECVNDFGVVSRFTTRSIIHL